MNQTQKYLFELPILALFFWIWQALELSVLRLPFGAGGIQIIPSIVTYIALTRSWERTTLFAFLLVFVGSFNIGIPATTYIAAGVWTALFAKLFSSEFAVEGSQKFMLLAGGAHLCNKFLIFALLRYQHNALPFWIFIKDVTISSLSTMALSYFVFPYLVRWDEYFEHAIDESRDLNPDVLR